MNTKEKKYSSKVAGKIYFIKQLNSLGLSNKYTGYYMIIEIIQILINEEVRVKSFSKEVYPVIAKKYGKTPCTVERNIRNLIEKSWNYDLMVKLNVYYPQEYKPTCCDFIYMIKNYIAMQIM